MERRYWPQCLHNLSFKIILCYHYIILRNHQESCGVISVVHERGGRGAETLQNSSSRHSNMASCEPTTQINDFCASECCKQSLFDVAYNSIIRNLQVTKDNVVSHEWQLSWVVKNELTKPSNILSCASTRKIRLGIKFIGARLQNLKSQHRQQTS